jgi:hypothetical protein
LEDGGARQPVGFGHPFASSRKIIAEFYQFGCGIGLWDYNGKIRGCPCVFPELECEKFDLNVNIRCGCVAAISQDIRERDFRSLIIKNEIASNANLRVYPWPLRSDESFAGYFGGILGGLGGFFRNRLSPRQHIELDDANSTQYGGEDN